MDTLSPEITLGLVVASGLALGFLTAFFHTPKTSRLLRVMLGSATMGVNLGILFEVLPLISDATAIIVAVLNVGMVAVGFSVALLTLLEKEVRAIK